MTSEIWPQQSYVISSDKTSAESSNHRNQQSRHLFHNPADCVTPSAKSNNQQSDLPQKQDAVILVPKFLNLEDSMTNPPLRTLLDFAMDAAWQAGRITLGYFLRDITVEKKQDSTPVTIADRQAEQEIRKMINQYWPGHAILGEEFGLQGEPDGLTWIIDPIDGTKSFVHGVPLYATLLALVDGKTPLLGVIHLPALGESVYAARGEGCFWNGRPARVSQVNELDKAVLLATSLNQFKHCQKGAAWDRLMDATYIQRTWGDAYGYALVATGRAEIMLDPAMSLWDCGPLQVILEEAGGTFTDWQGNPTIFGSDSIATNGHLFDDVMRLVRGE